MENHDCSAPYINSLARTYGLATNYFATAHPSLPNDIALTSGSTQGIAGNNPPSYHQSNVDSIFSQLPAGSFPAAGGVDVIQLPSVQLERVQA